MVVFPSPSSRSVTQSIAWKGSYRINFHLNRLLRSKFTTSALLCSTPEGRTPKNRESSPRSGESRLGRGCIVTGGASGIGYSISKQLVLQGAASVVIVSRGSDKAQAAIQRIKQETGMHSAPLSFIAHDFKQPVEGLLEQWHVSGTDTLINCAGVSQTEGLLATDSTTVSDILRVNLEVPIQLSRHLLKDYFSRGRRQKQNSTGMPGDRQSLCVVNVSSLLATRGGYGSSIYSTSKAGLIAFTRTLALEAAAIRTRFPVLPAFRANVIVPGYIDTPMISNFSYAQKEKLVSEIPLKRYGTAEEVADAVMFLLRNEYANNTVLNLDGGLSAV